MAAHRYVPKTRPKKVASLQIVDPVERINPKRHFFLHFKFSNNIVEVLSIQPFSYTKMKS